MWVLTENSQESELIMWVIKPTAKITMRRVDLKALQQKSKTSLAELIKEIILPKTTALLR